MNTLAIIIIETVFILITLATSSLGAYLIRKGKTESGLIEILSSVLLLTAAFLQSLAIGNNTFGDGIFACLLENLGVYSWIILIMYCLLIILSIYNLVVLIKEKSTLKDDKDIKKNLKKSSYIVPLYILVLFGFLCGAYLGTDKLGYKCQTIYTENFLDENRKIAVPQNSCYMGYIDENLYGFRSLKSADKLDSKLKSITEKYNAEHDIKVAYKIEKNRLYNEYYLHFDK